MHLMQNGNRRSYASSHSSMCWKCAVNLKYLV
uniref:Uncharacterized protein n=1 Tax=Arundo donax TaxID=35708 RepID=A0A0A9BYV7_ARUDO